ncbi:hypothetical protein J1614_000761 [Plenodomus biglobosus]|nr:hypothetical protein J1614_000761 [Plenodomus biglobosus]
MRSLVFGALLLRTLNAQVSSDSVVSSADSASATVAPLLAPVADAPTESQLSEAAAAAVLPIVTDLPLPLGTPDVLLPESPLADLFLPTDVIELIPTETETGSGLDALLISATPLYSSGNATVLASAAPSITEALVIPLGPGILVASAASTSVSTALGASNLASGLRGAKAGSRGKANYAGSVKPGGGWSGGDDGSYDGQDYGDDWDDGQTEGSDSYGYGDDVECPADCHCEEPVYESDKGYPPPPGYSSPPYSPAPEHDGGYDPYAEGGDGEDAPYGRKLRARQAASGGFAAFNWPGASDDGGDGASDGEDLPDWLYDSAGVEKPKPKCPKVCCIKPTDEYPSKPTEKYPIDPAPAYTKPAMRPTGYVDPAPTDEPWYNAPDKNTTSSDSYASPTWTTLVSSVSGYAPAASADYTGDTLAGICPKTCDPDAEKNYCDITTSCTTSGGSKDYCACRAGYMASAWNAKDFSKQFRVDGQPFVYVAPGVVCDKVCGEKTCKDVLTRPKCA